MPLLPDHTKLAVPCGQKQIPTPHAANHRRHHRMLFFTHHCPLRVFGKQAVARNAVNSLTIIDWTRIFFWRAFAHVSANPREVFMIIRMISIIFITVFLCTIPACSFSFPQLFWPQKDIDSFSVNQPTLAKKVLIVSRNSNFKRAVVDKIKNALRDEPVYVKCTGLTKLKNEDASAYSVIVIINTCMAWDWDRNIHAFLKGKQDARKVIVLTTSGSGKWLPKKIPAGVDAIASASEKTDVVAADIIGRIRSLLATR
jgi:hypothetical protein